MEDMTMVLPLPHAASLTVSLTHHDILFHETDSSSKCSSVHSSSSHCWPIKLATEDKINVSLWLFCWTNDNYLLVSQTLISLPLLISLSIFTEGLTIWQALRAASMTPCGANENSCLPTLILSSIYFLGVTLCFLCYNITDAFNVHRWHNAWSVTSWSTQSSPYLETWVGLLCKQEYQKGFFVHTKEYQSYHILLSFLNISIQAQLTKSTWKYDLYPYYLLSISSSISPGKKLFYLPNSSVLHISSLIS